MNDQAKQDINNEVVEEAVLEAAVEQKADEKISEKNVQTITDDHIKTVDEKVSLKEKEIMTI